MSIKQLDSFLQIKFSQDLVPLPLPIEFQSMLYYPKQITIQKHVHKKIIQNLQIISKDTSPILEKPEAFQVHNDTVTFFYKDLGLSLEKQLIVRRDRLLYFPKIKLVDFIKKTLYYLANNQNTRICHGNLKPSNIFLNQQRIAITDTFLPTNRLNMVYVSPQQQLKKKQSIMNSLSILSSQNNSKMDVYALGIILVQISTLVLPRQLECFRQQSQESLKKQKSILEMIQKSYGKQIRQLLSYMLYADIQKRPKAKDIINSQVFSKVKELKEISQEGAQQYDMSQLKDYKRINPKVFYQFVKSQIKLELFLDFIHGRDIEQTYTFSKLSVLDKFLGDIGFSQRSPLAVFSFFNSSIENSQFKLVPVIAQIYKEEEWLKAIIKKGLSYSKKNFSLIKASYFSQNKSIDVYKLLQICKSFIKFDINQYLSSFSWFPKGGASEEYFKAHFLDQQAKVTVKKVLDKSILISFIHQFSLMLKPKSLFQFFNDLDIKNRFQVDRAVNNQIQKKYQKPCQNQLQVMWLCGSYGATRQLLRYLRIIRIDKNVSHSQLFKQIWKSIMNKQGKSCKTIFDQFAVKGAWTLNQFGKFNQFYTLEFSQKQIISIFNSIDRNKSKDVSFNQLLSFIDINVFDISTVTFIIQERLSQLGVSPFNAFCKYHSKNELFIQQQDFVKVLSQLCPEIKNFAKQFYDSFRQREKVNLIDLSRSFSKPFPIFSEAMLFVANQIKGSLKDIFNQKATKSQKWTVSSLYQCAIFLDMPFSKSQLNQIWQNLDSKKQIQIDFQTFSNKLGVGVNKQQSQKILQKSKSLDKSDKINQNFIKLAQQGQVVKAFQQNDKDFNLQISKADFIKIIRKFKISGEEKSINSFINPFIKQNKINYLNMFMKLPLSRKAKLHALQLTFKKAIQYQNQEYQQILSNNFHKNYTVRQFKHFVQDLEINIDQETILFVWEILDQDRNGQLTPSQLQHLLKIQLKVQNTKKSISNKVVEQERVYKDLSPIQSLKNRVKREGFLFEKFDKSKKGHLTQNQLFLCLTSKEGYDLPKQMAKDLVKVWAELGTIKISALNQLLLQRKESKALQSMAVSKLKQKRKLNNFLCSQLINQIKTTFSKKKPIFEMIPHYFQRSQSIRCDTFVKKTIQIQKINVDLAQELFDFLDPLNTGFLNKVVFKSNFLYNSTQKTDQVVFPAQIQNQLAVIFKRADKDGSGSIQANELPQLLNLIGQNISQKDSYAFVKRIDKDKSQSINFIQFKQFIQETIFQKNQAGDLNLTQLQLTLKKHSLSGTGKLTLNQLVQGLASAKIVLPEDQLSFLFNQLDKTKTNKIDIKRFIHSIIKPRMLSGRAKMAIYRIKLGKNLSFRQIKNCFTSLPSCYTSSQVESLVRSNKFTVSSFIRPKLNDYGIAFEQYVFNRTKDSDQFSVGYKKMTGINIRIQIQNATGVPLPSQTLLPKASILERNLIVYLYDEVQGQFILNPLFIQAEWDQSIEDQWVFKARSKDSLSTAFYFRFEEYSEKHAFKSLVFQFVLTVNLGSSISTISCGSSVIKLNEIEQLSKGQKVKLPIEGGVPGRRRLIKAQNITQKRTGFKSLFRSSQIVSELIINVEPKQSFQTNQYTKYLPLSCLANERCLSLVKHFKEFFGDLLKKYQFDPQVMHDQLVASLLNAIDCPILFPRLVQTWNKYAEPNIINASQSRNFMQKFASQLMLLLRTTNFSFDFKYPGKLSYFPKGLTETRTKLIDQWVNRVKSEQNVQKGLKWQFRGYEKQNIQRNINQVMFLI